VTQYGLGKHDWTLTPEQLINYGRVQFTTTLRHRLPLTVSVLLDLGLLLRRITLLHKNGFPPPISPSNVRLTHAPGLHRLHGHRLAMERVANTRYILFVCPTTGSLGPKDKGELFPA